MPPSHPRSQTQDNKEPEESHRCRASQSALSSRPESACRTACSLAHMKQPLKWQLVIHAIPLLPARPRHVALLRDISASAYSSIHYLMKSFFAPLLHFKPMMACCQH